MIHGTPQLIARGCTCNLCTLVREQAEPAKPTRIPSARVRAHLDALSDSGWSIAELARRLGYHENTLYDIRKGRTLRTAQYIAEDILTVQPKPITPRTAGEAACMHCDRPARTRGLCHRHWREAKEGVIPMPQPRRRYTSIERADRIAATRRRRLDLLIAEVDALVTAGMPVEAAVDQVGWGRSAAARALYRRGRLDLARPLQRLVTAARRAA